MTAKSEVVPTRKSIWSPISTFPRVILTPRARRFVVSVTAHPTAAWTAQQLREAFPCDQVINVNYFYTLGSFNCR